jgi:hypothetical protein
MHALLARRLKGSQLAELGGLLVRSAATSAGKEATKAPLNKEFQVYRWNPDDGKAPSYETYTVDLNS